MAHGGFHQTFLRAKIITDTGRRRAGFLRNFAHGHRAQPVFVHSVQSGFDELCVSDISYFDALHGFDVPCQEVICNEI